MHYVLFIFLVLPLFRKAVNNNEAVQFLGSSRIKILCFAEYNNGISTQKKTHYRNKTSHSLFLHNGFVILFFSQYVNTHILSSFKVMGYPVWVSLIILFDNSFSYSGESTDFLRSLFLHCLFSAKYALRVLLGTL